MAIAAPASLVPFASQYMLLAVAQLAAKTGVGIMPRRDNENMFRSLMEQGFRHMWIAS